MQMDSQMEETQRAKRPGSGAERPHALRHLHPSSSGCSATRGRSEPCASCPGGFVTHTRLIIRSILSSPSLSGGWEMGLKILGFWGQLGISVTSPNPEAHPGHLIGAKDILITEEIPRAPRTLCQDQGQRPSRTKDAPFVNTLYMLFTYMYVCTRKLFYYTW